MKTFLERLARWLRGLRAGLRGPRRQEGRRARAAEDTRKNIYPLW